MSSTDCKASPRRRQHRHQKYCRTGHPNSCTNVPQHELYQGAEHHQYRAAELPERSALALLPNPHLDLEPLPDLAGSEATELGLRDRLRPSPWQALFEPRAPSSTSIFPAPFPAADDAALERGAAAACTASDCGEEPPTTASCPANVSCEACCCNCCWCCPSCGSSCKRTGLALSGAAGGGIDAAASRRTSCCCC